MKKGTKLKLIDLRQLTIEKYNFSALDGLIPEKIYTVKHYDEEFGAVIVAGSKHELWHLLDKFEIVHKKNQNAITQSNTTKDKIKTWLVSRFRRG